MSGEKSLKKDFSPPSQPSIQRSNIEEGTRDAWMFCSGDSHVHRREKAEVAQ